ncbi:STAS domain-containing protein [Actinoplanes sp. LDG1-06]|uniref:Anti-sigma factor antagonist n=1 Tax=Paractinoplanes ovalisporus TaxID=2810368 RepID=A0ABS2AFF2_9ACTN|nr:STAS domain-containing protein [Actinoplanes ovalisporus]MBM2618006.1 STAS domain-containing protein [Actinoplanes ovalisporus]
MESSINRSLDADGSATVTVVGEVDFSNADELAGSVRDAVTEWSPPSVRVDLKSATFIDSTGLGALIEGYRAATEIESRFLVINPSPAFRRVLEVTGLCDFFGLGATVEAGGETETAGQTRATGA